MFEMRQTLLTVGLAIGAAVSAAPGKLILNGETIVLSHVYARKAPQTFDEKKDAYYVLAVDRELPAEIRSEPDEVRRLVWDGKLHGVEIEFSDDSVSWMLKTSKLKGSISGSRSPNPYKIAFTGGRAKGEAKMEKAEKLGETTYQYDFTVDVPIEAKAVQPEPTAADKAAAKNSAAAKAYVAYLAVLAKGDKAGLMKAVDPEKAKMIDTPDFPKMVQFVQQMQPKNIEVLRAVETGDNAVLTVSGDAGKSRGTVKMKRAGTNWLIMHESWSSKN